MIEDSQTAQQDSQTTQEDSQTAQLDNQTTQQDSQTTQLDDQTPQQEAQPAKPKGIPKVAWIAGCGCLLVIAVIAAALLAYFLFFKSGDPIAKAVPADSMVYMNVDLTKTQSERFVEIVNIFQEITDEKVQAPSEAMDETLKEELDMNFEDNIKPWIGKHAALVIVDGDFQSGDVQMMFIVETLNKGKADEFITQFAEALDKKQGKKFEKTEKDGIALYGYEGVSESDNMVVARSGSLVYISNSEDAVLRSAKLPKSDSLASSESYKATLAVLPKNSLATIYLNGDKYFEVFQGMMSDLSPTSPVPMDKSLYAGIEGMGVSVSVEDAGLRVDMATVYNVEELGDFQKNSVNAVLSAPTTDAMVPEDTFLWFGVKSSQNMSDLMKEGSPLYSTDMQEAFDLMEQQYGVDMAKLFGTFGGEVAMAVGPASDGLLAESGGTDIGLTIIASVTDEQGFTDWFDGVVATTSEQMGAGLITEKVKIGSYDLQKIAVDAGSPTPSTLLVYGASNGFGFLSSSHDMLANGLEGGKTLAANETYIKTWKAFPSGSIPYMYVDMNGLMELIAQSAGGEMSDMQDKLKKIPVIALSTSRPAKNAQNVTMIVFMETEIKP